MHESVFELVDRFAAALPQSDDLTQPVDSIVRRLEARVNRLGRTADRLEHIADHDARELFRSISGDLKATKVELLHWQVILARLTGSEVPLDPVPKGEWVAMTPTQPASAGPEGPPGTE
jgi:hypothetical protein